MLFALLGVFLSIALGSGVANQAHSKQAAQCSGDNHLLVQGLFNNSDIDQVCDMYGMRPAQVTFSNFQAVLDDLSDCIIGGKKRKPSPLIKQADEDNLAWIGGIEGYGNCVTLDLLGPITWDTSCDGTQHMVVCQSWDYAVYTTVTFTSTVCSTPTTPSTTFRTHITVEFTGRLELDVWQVNKSAQVRKSLTDGGACGANGILILTNSTGYLDSRTACQETNPNLSQLDLTAANYPVVQQVIGACLGTDNTSVWVNSYNGLGIVDNDTNAPCGYVNVSPGAPELVLLNDEGTCEFISHWVVCQTNPPAVTSLGPTPISATTMVTSYETVTVTTRCC
jgi:hypothetical protein